MKETDVNVAVKPVEQKSQKLNLTVYHGEEIIGEISIDASEPIQNLIVLIREASDRWVNL